jgi:hypothetical protein
VVAGLLERDMGGRVAHEQHGDQERRERDDGGEDDEHVAGRIVGGKPPGQAGGEGYAAVAGGLVEAEREAAAARADEVDLHDHGHGPGEALVGAEQDVGGDDPRPARRDGDQQRDRQRERPARDQQTPAAEALGQRSGTEVGQRLGEPEGDDESEHGRAGGQPEVLAPDEWQRRALKADHRADERVDGDQQGELREVLAQSEAGHARLAATIVACSAGAGGRFSSCAFTNASSDSNCSARLWRRSKPTVELGLPDSPRPHTEPE